MIRPVNFGFNPETAVNNSFQENTGADVQQKALEEFNGLVTLLENNHVRLTVINDTAKPSTPDSIFPNNWISFHEDELVFIYPMFAANRRLEKKPHILEKLTREFSISKVIDLSSYEKENRFLEGTGSMVLDRVNRIAYACLSPRTEAGILNEWCRLAGYMPVSFISKDITGNDIYHTNVMMCLADKYAVVCMESIPDKKDQLRLKDSLTASGKEIIEISIQQVNCFAGNMLQVINSKGELLLVMSAQAYQSLDTKQVNILQQFNRIIHSPLDTIETSGGGSARCMLAEVFCKTKNNYQ